MSRFSAVKKNRVAGPQFVTNVRFDDYHIAECRGQVGSAGSSSTQIPAAREEEVYDVKEGELLVCKRNTSMYSDSYAHCFTAINGFPDTANLSGDALKEKILQDVSFIGIAETEYKQSGLGSYSEQGFVAVVAGVKTILNESCHDLYPGQRLMLDIDLSTGRKATREKGIPRSKVRFTVKPASDQCALITEALVLTGKAGAGANLSTNIRTLQSKITKLRDEREKLRGKEGFDAADKKVQEAKKEFADATAAKCGVESVKSMQDFLEKYRMLNERCIGTCLSYARPGERFEILVGTRNAY